MKKVISLFVGIICALSMCVPVLANDAIQVVLDGKSITFDVPPQIINGRTMVPIRAIFENMGATVDWDSTTSSAICRKEDAVVTMTVNSMDMYINNQLTKMDVSPVVIDGRTLAPARYVAEAFGANVQWSQKNNTVVICSKDVYAYADYPDIPDLGKCYNIPVLSETIQGEYKTLHYVYSDMSDEEYQSYLYDNSALVLGEYAEVPIDTTNGVVTIAYTKRGETIPRYFVIGRFDQNGAMVFDVQIPIDDAYVAETMVTLYALDGRTIEVAESEVDAYLKVGWYKTLEETQQTLYASDGRTIKVYKSEVAAYKNVGWYETKAEASAANKPANSTTGKTQNTTSTSKNASADGNYYRTPTGKKYHLDPNCGGKNSYKTTDISGLSPCSKCAK